ncbi:MAG: Gfo/Idh/MocA family oxidoreductase [Anaerolineaceae bacterium]|nr:Gfo/Idh/MocA family oxidoreductase [Anaerolineaceae bacterium]
MVNVGVIGSGGMGGRHIRNLAAQTPAQVVAIMDLDRERAEAVAAQTGGGQVYTDPAALITDPKVEAVVVASPDPFHAEAVLACIEAGKPVLCEKPLATNLPDAKNVLEAEMAAGKRLVQLAFMREYDPAHQAVKASAENGALGQLLMFHGIHSGYGVGYPRTTDDVIINSAVHDIHSARWLLNQEIAQVYVQRVVADAARPETCRLLLVQLTFQDGSLGFIEVNADSSYGYQVDVELTGSDGSIRTARAAAPMVRQAGREFQSIDEDWLVRFDVAYVYEVQAWVQSLMTGRPTGPSTWDGYAAMIVADACIQSAKTGQPQAVPTLDRPAMYAR